MNQSDCKKDSNDTKTGKVYTPPRLVSYGHVKDVIQGAKGKKVDVPGRLSKAGCWIAEALYGVDDARTVLLRAWLSVVYAERRPGWQFVMFYRVFGRQTAFLIRAGVLPEYWFRPLFDRLVERAIADAPRAFAVVRL